jgi:hypothetical protein
LAELYTPKLVTVFREGYSVADFRAEFANGSVDPPSPSAKLFRNKANCALPFP